jgi:hypothetical protein
MTPEGTVVDVPEEKVGAAIAQGFRPLTGQEGTTFETAPKPDSSVASSIAAGANSVLSGATLGLYDAGVRALSSKGTADAVAKAEAEHPYISAGGSLVGAAAPALLSGGATAEGSIAELADALPAAMVPRAGAAASEAVGGGLVGRIAGGAAEGTIYGAGQGVSQLALSDDPVDVEHVASALSSNMLYGAAFGGAGGAAAHGLEAGLSKASGLLRSAADAGEKAAALPEDLAALDAKGLRTAKDAELERLQSDQMKTRADAVSDVATYRDQLTEANPWLVAEGENASRLSRSAKAIRNAMDDAEGLAKNPSSLLKPLRIQAKALQGVLDEQESLAAKFAETNGKLADALEEDLATLPDRAESVELTGKAARRYGAYAGEKVGKGARISVARDDAQEFLAALRNGEIEGDAAASLKRVPDLLAANRSLQTKIESSLLAKSELASPRLAAIADAEDALRSGKATEASFGARMAGGAAYGKASALMSLVPGGHLLAPAVGAAASKAVSAAIDKIAPALRQGASRAADVVDAFLGGAKRLAPAAPALATATLRAVRYAPADAPKGRKSNVAERPDDELAQLYAQRSAEIRSQTMYDPTGKAVMRPEARAQMAARFDGLRMHDPRGMDALETAAARRIEYLANALPRKPDAMATGADTWRPSELEMRAFARKVDAAEHPENVEQRLIDGSLTPEDVEAYRTCYPARAQALETSIISGMGARGAKLSYARRLSLSMFTGRPMDPSLDPGILRVLQATFTNEDGSAGGTRAPVPRPQFGSVRGDMATPSQERESALK